MSNRVIKFHKDLISSFLAVLLTDKRTWHRWTHNLLDGEITTKVHVPATNDAGEMLCRCSSDGTVDSQSRQVSMQSTPVRHHPGARGRRRHCVVLRLLETLRPARCISASPRRQLCFHKLPHKRTIRLAGLRLQLYDSTSIRLSFDRRSTPIRPQFDPVTTIRLRNDRRPTCTAMA